jgi:hypothetical protein
MKRHYVFILLQTIVYIYNSSAHLVKYLAYTSIENANTLQPISTDFSQAIINCLKGESSFLIKIFLTEFASYEVTSQSPSEIFKVKGNCEISGPDSTSLAKRPILEIKDTYIELLTNASLTISNLRLSITRSRQIQAYHIFNCLKDSSITFQVIYSSKL